MREEKTFQQLSLRIEGVAARIETMVDPKARASRVTPDQAREESSA